LFDWNRQLPPPAIRPLNRVLQRFRVHWQLRRSPDPRRDMTNFEQRLSLWHLVSQPLAYGVPGDVVELGCFDGKTAVIFAKVIEELDPARSLHLFDHFKVEFKQQGRDIRARVLEHFQMARCVAPLIHEGDFLDTVPGQLPETIAFVHIDCGFGGNPREHQATIQRLLEHVYPRMPRGAIGVLMDYHDLAQADGVNHNPGVKPAADTFFTDKPEKVGSLWADEYAHGYFRKR
jgi:O-methyltransferase